MTNKTYKKIAILLAVGAILAIGGYVAALYGSSGPDAAPNLSEYGLVGFWNMEEGKGQTVFDRSGNGNNGILGASTAVAKDDPVFTSGYSSAGAGGTGLKFDGVDDYVNAGNVASLNTIITKTTPYTIEGWAYIKSDEATYGRTIVSFSINSSDRHGIIFRAGQIRSGIYNGTSYFVKKSGVAALNTWYHIVVTFDGSSNFNLYLNSVLQTGIDSPFLSSANKFIIGADSEGAYKFFDGTIDEVRIYNRALSADEIRQHYNQKKPILEWKFDEGSGTAVKDEGFNNYDGTLH